jgi:uncharacterized protein (DUF362 family)
MHPQVSRRSLLLGALAAPGRARVIVARDPRLQSPGQGSGLNTGRLIALLDRAVPPENWRRVVRPGETVGLKVNCLAGKGISTHVALVEAICERLQQAGVSRRNIIIWDRLNSDLESAGFRISESRDRIRCFGNDTAGYEDELTVSGAAASMLSKTLTRLCDAIINLPVLKDHGIAGVTMALKNMFGAIHNPNKYHPNACDPYVADVYRMPAIQRKVRLTICDATTAQYEGGPSFMPHWTWPCNTLLVSEDPVALDTVGWQIIEQKRAEKGLKSLKSLKREPAYIATAARYGLGVNDLRRIDKIEV